MSVVNTLHFIAAVVCTLAVANAVPSGLGLGLGLGLGVPGAVLTAPSATAVVAGPALGLGGIGAITSGGGAIALSGAGAAVQGPPTAPVVVAGPSGKIAADGLWGPTLALGPGALGHGWGR